MQLRTTIDIPREHPLLITHDDSIVMLGSCFTDSVGQLLDRDGFDVVHNPMGPLYNAASIYGAIRLALDPAPAGELTLRQDDDGVWHCLDFASRYAHPDRDTLVATVTGELRRLADAIRRADTVILTLGTSFVYALRDSDTIVGNCHKLRPQRFVRYMMDTALTRGYLQRTLGLLGADRRVIFTVSPIRHTADTLHGNQLSKAVLQLAADSVVADNTHVHYFPSYEVMLDDLRDYRFYATDMKHPSELAVEYIYEVFGSYYCDNRTLNEANIQRKQHKRSQHRPLC